MAWILSYGCTSSAGSSVAEFWTALCAGQELSREIDFSAWPVPVPSTLKTRAYLWKDKSLAPGTARDELNRQIQTAWHEAWDGLDADARNRIRSGAPLGVIFASTKGSIDDLVWLSDSRRLEIELQTDSLTPLLQDFLRTTELEPSRSVCVSNACVSTLAALNLARTWIRSGRCDDVLVIAADRVGPFVIQGFQSLRVLTPEATRPFSGDRSGFFLGDAAAALIVSKHRGANRLKLSDASIDAEGYAVTRPSQSGESLKRACQSLEGLGTPDLVIAHGTGTVVNDAVEDTVLHSLFEAARPAITGTKWCIGHTLGTSGGMDVIAACEALLRQESFALGTTASADSRFQGRYLTRGTGGPMALRRILVTSLGFGGIHAAALVEKEP